MGFRTGKLEDTNKETWNDSLQNKSIFVRKGYQNKSTKMQHRNMTHVDNSETYDCLCVKGNMTGSVPIQDFIFMTTEASKMLKLFILKSTAI